MLMSYNKMPDLMLILKIVFVIVIVASPFITFDKLLFMNTLSAKLTIVLLIVVACFVDFQVALLMTITFLVMVINMNSKAVTNITSVSKDTFKNPTPAMYPTAEFDVHFEKQELPEVKDASRNVACPVPRVNNINEHMMHLFVDDKIKPYDVYISMMTSDEHLAKAQGALI